MKLVRFGAAGAEKPGLIDQDGTLRDLSGEVPDIGGDTLSDAGLEAIRGLEVSSLPAVSGEPRLGPCVGNIGKYVCIGLNYSDHAEEANMPIPDEPIIFFKATSSIMGPNDDIVLPKDAEKVDWEVELCIVIGKEARYVSEADALTHVAGYCVANDVSERHFQLERSGQWVKGKSADTFGPIGPWLVTRDEVPDPQNLEMWLDVDGERRQSGSTRTMIFSAAHIVSYVSQFMSLQPGDIIATGTPPGVGMGHKPPVYLSAGQTVRLGVEGLGEQTQKTRAWEG